MSQPGPASTPNKSLTIAALIASSTSRTPDAIALAAPQRTPLTYRGLAQQVDYVSQTLSNFGMADGAGVALVLPNGPELAAVFIAVSAAVACAPLNPGYRENEFDFYLSDLHADAVIIPRSVDSAVRRVAQKRDIAVIELDSQPHTPAGVFQLYCDDRQAQASRSVVAKSDLALLLHTSGTTSRPKLVPLTQENICTSAHNIAAALQLTPHDCSLNVMPLFHIHGLGTLLASLSVGGCVVCTPGFDAGKFFGWLEEFRPTWYSAVPTMHEAVLARANMHADTARQSSLRLIRSASSALSPQVMRGLEAAFGVPVIESYGMTEAAHQICTNPLPPGQRKPGSVGLPGGPEVSIMGPGGNLLKPGEKGEIVLRGTNVCSGYESNPAANEAAFTHGWFRTGDQGFLDADGYLVITGRIKEIINRGGEKIAPREVEEGLLDHSAIAQCVAFGIPHQTLGEDLAVAVVLRHGATASEQEIRQFALTRLTEHKVPNQVAIVEQIPKGPTGKVQRIGLYEKLADLMKPPYVPPSEPVQQALVSIFAEVLQIKKVGIHDNFFSLGGDSLSATRVVARIQANLKIALPLTTILRFPTIAELALTVEDLLLSELEAA